MNFHDLAGQNPKDIDEALKCQLRALERYHPAGHKPDKRAIFLRLYYIMTLEVQAAIKGYGVYAGKEIFIDPDWVRSLSGKFSTLYFESLGPNCSRAWEVAYKAVGDPRSSVVENALLGINAHINYDLPRAIAMNLTDADLSSYETMQIRKFDHDQVNNLLVRVLDQIQDTLAADYEPGISAADRLMGGLDERMSEIALKYYRERVWWDALAFAAAQRRQKAAIVAEKLNWESYKIALVVRSRTLLWAAERALNTIVSLFKRRRAQITFEQRGGLELRTETPVNLVHPNPRLKRGHRDGHARQYDVPRPPLAMSGHP